MTRKEEIKQLELLLDYCESMITSEAPVWARDCEALKAATSALQGPAREQVEKMRGEWEPFGGKYISRKKCSRCGWDGQEHIKFYSWCPACGAPMTDEAVDMTMKKLEEALKSET